MRVVVIGASGTIGQAVVQAILPRHEIVCVGRTRGDYRVDLANKESLQRLMGTVSPFDAIVCAAGQASFGALKTLTDEDFYLGISNKLMGQVNLVRVGLSYISGHGSFTLTSGVLAREPMQGSAAISLVNAALEGFVRAAALEMPRGIRINVVSPPWVRETLAAMGRDSSTGMPATEVAAAYVESVEGKRNGEVIDARFFA
jgi:NAD(P)-dependent dehydrogenase (short-subunit alcohol dehydrogenase family)